jgi:hypothetical protein
MLDSVTKNGAVCKLPYIRYQKLPEFEISQSTMAYILEVGVMGKNTEF